jgi:hypothetical protein
MLRRQADAASGDHPYRRPNTAAKGRNEVTARKDCVATTLVDTVFGFFVTPRRSGKEGNANEQSVPPFKKNGVDGEPHDHRDDVIACRAGSDRDGAGSLALLQ